jgi:predicted nucleotidyltransferase
MLTRRLHDREQAVVDRVAATVRDIEPTARIVLYGSRVRGDARPDSDWDLLVLLDGAVDQQRATRVRHRIYALERELESAPVLSTIVLTRREWDDPHLAATPFRAEVEHHGLDL